MTGSIRPEPSPSSGSPPKGRATNFMAGGPEGDSACSPNGKPNIAATVAATRMRGGLMRLSPSAIVVGERVGALTVDAVAPQAAARPASVEGGLQVGAVARRLHESGRLDLREQR